MNADAQLSWELTTELPSSVCLLRLVPRVLRPFLSQVPCAMQSGGKRKSRASVASIAAGSLTLHDANSNKTFLIDTGAEVSVVPATEQERQKAPMEKELVAANGSRIRCYGEKKVRFHIGARTYEWKFLSVNAMAGEVDFSKDVPVDANGTDFTTGDAASSDQTVKKEANEDRKLFVGGLSWETRENQLKEYFEKFGEVESVELKLNPVTGQSRCFAFVVYTEPSSIDKVLDAGDHVGVTTEAREMNCFISERIV